MKCMQPGCAGEIVDGYCNVCGTAPRREQASPDAGSRRLRVKPGRSPLAQRTGQHAGCPAEHRHRPALHDAHIGVASQPARRRVWWRCPPIPYRDPPSAVMADPTVAESAAVLRALRRAGRADRATARRVAPRGSAATAARRSRSRRSCVAGDVVAGQYEVVGCLAHGGMGWIYLAQDRNVSDRWVVLKGLLNTGDADAMAAALAERRFLAEVEHPNIVKIFNFVEHEDSGYIVMEYVGGHEPEADPDRAARGQRREARSAAGRPGDRLHARDPAGARLPPSTGPAVLRLQARQRHPDAALAEADRPRRRLPDRRASSPVYGTVGYQAPEIAEAGPSIPSDLFTVARTLARPVHRLQGLPEHATGTRCPPRTTCRCSDASTRSTASCSRARRPIPTTASSRPRRWPTSSSACCARSSPPRRTAGAGARARCSPATSGPASSEPDWRLLPALRVDTDDPAAGFLATLSAADPAKLIALLRSGAGADGRGRPPPRARR